MDMRRGRMACVAFWTVGLLVTARAMAGSLDPTSAPGPTMHTLEDIYQKVGALAAPRTLSPTTTIVAAGYYAATNLTQVDTDLTAVNIRSGTSVFGVAGSNTVMDTTSGNATAGDLLAGKTAYVKGAVVTGTIATQTLSPVNATVAAGYYAATNLTQVDADLATANIRSGTTIFGVAGSNAVVDTTAATATAADLLLGKTAYAKGALVTGAVTTQTLSPLTAAVSAGYYTATNLTQVDADLATANIRAGSTIFGVVGSNTVLDTTAGTATAGDVRSGKTVYVKGTAVTGTITTQTLTLANAIVSAGLYAATNLVQVDADLATANIKAGMTIFGVAGSNNVVDTTVGTATAGDLLSGKTAYARGALVTGSIATQTRSPNNVAVVAGYYAATNLTFVDMDLTAVNIRTNVTIFGIAGTCPGSNAVGGTYYAAVPRTGQTTSYQAEDDGNRQRGVVWPNPRFTIGASGAATNCVTDNLTGLMWARNANMAGDIVPWNATYGEMNWYDAIAFCEGLTYGGYSDWRLPNIRELYSLMDLSRVNPTLCNTVGTGQWTPGDPFINVRYSTGPNIHGYGDWYWSSTSYADGLGWIALPVSLEYGPFGRPSGYNSNYYYVWPVRGGN